MVTKFTPAQLDSISTAIADLDVAPEAKIQASELVSAWVNKYTEIDSKERTLAVEVAFAVQVDSHTWVIGVMDRLSLTSKAEIIVNEWKSSRAATSNGYSKSRWSWGEDMWLREITNSIQLPTYALGLREGRFVLKSSGRPFKIKGASTTDEVKVRVRAVTKESLPKFWPSSRSGVYAFDSRDVQHVKNVYINAAAFIRAGKVGAGRNAFVPWQARGRQCFNQFGRDCELFDLCASHDYVTGPYHVLDPGDPEEFDWLEKFGLTELKRDPRNVILSASSYDLFSLCKEKYRARKLVGGVGEEKSMALQVGSALHCGLAVFYLLLK